MRTRPNASKCVASSLVLAPLQPPRSDDDEDAAIYPPRGKRRPRTAPAAATRRRQHSTPSATATTRPQPTRDQVGHPFEWYALHFALSCIGPLIDPGTRTQKDDTNNNEAPRTSARPMAPTWPHSPSTKTTRPSTCATINGSTGPHSPPATRRRLHGLRAAIQPPLSDYDATRRRLHGLRAAIQPPLSDYDAPTA